MLVGGFRRVFGNVVFFMRFCFGGILVYVVVVFEVFVVVFVGLIGLVVFGDIFVV